MTCSFLGNEKFFSQQSSVPFLALEQNLAALSTETAMSKSDPWARFGRQPTIVWYGNFSIAFFPCSDCGSKFLETVPDRQGCGNLRTIWHQKCSSTSCTCWDWDRQRPAIFALIHFHPQDPLELATMFDVEPICDVCLKCLDNSPLPHKGEVVHMDRLKRIQACSFHEESKNTGPLVIVWARTSGSMSEACFKSNKLFNNHALRNVLLMSDCSRFHPSITATARRSFSVVNRVTGACASNTSTCVYVKPFTTNRVLASELHPGPRFVLKTHFDPEVFVLLSFLKFPRPIPVKSLNLFIHHFSPLFCTLEIKHRCDVLGFSAITSALSTSSLSSHFSTLW